jgi:DNA uptake protein ComE-like DNA-binding protein
MNMDGEGMQDLRAYYRRQLVMQGVVKPTKDEQAEMDQAKAGQQPGPQDQALMAMANQANAEADQAHAKTLDTMAAATLKQAQTGLTKAQTVETMARATSEHVGQAVDVSDAVMRASTPPKPVTT